MVVRLKELGLATLGDIYDAETDGLAAFVLAEADLQPLTEQIDFRDVRKTRCSLRIGQVWGEDLGDGSYLLIEYLGRGKEGVHVRRWRTRWKRQARVGDTMVMDPEDFAHGAGTARGYPVEEVFGRVSVRAVLDARRKEGKASRKLVAVWPATQPWDLTDQSCAKEVAEEEPAHLARLQERSGPEQHVWSSEECAFQAQRA